MSYQTLTTNLGLAKIAAAIGSGQTISLPTIKLGDGNGNTVTPSPTQTDLVRVVYTGATNSLTASQTNPNRITAELVVPASVGGFTVREAGIYDAAGALIFVCNFPSVYKPLPSEGSARDLVVRIVFEVVNPGVVNLVIDTNVTVATRAWVTNNFTIAALLPGGTTYQILRKKSNANGDTEWVDPASGQNVIVNVIEENQILASGQTVVDLVTANTNSTAIYIEGVRLRNNQFSINTATRFTLAQSYPAGSRVTIVQNEPNGALGQATTESAGIVELATNAETQAGTDAIRAVTPAGLASAAALFVPPGAVMPFAMNASPSGWIVANGAAVSRTAYAALFAAIGTIYGAGDGSTTFALPDLRGYFVRGHGANADGTASGLFGDKQADAIVSHTHSYSAPSALVSDQHVGPGNFNVIGHVSITASNTGNTSTGVSAETRPKNIAMLYCIKF